jgi:hypothetical protein
VTIEFLATPVPNPYHVVAVTPAVDASPEITATPPGPLFAMEPD